MIHCTGSILKESSIEFLQPDLCLEKIGEIEQMSVKQKQSAELVSWQGDWGSLIEAIPVQC